jgi:hypothetical protein
MNPLPDFDVRHLAGAILFETITILIGIILAAPGIHGQHAAAHLAATHGGGR